MTRRIYGVVTVAAAGLGLALGTVQAPASARAVGADGAAAAEEHGWAAGLATAEEGRWQWPLAAHVVSAPYAAPPTRYAAGHRGVDLAAAAGAAVLAPDSAVVKYSGVVVDRPVLTLDHGGDVLSSYEPVVPALPAGSVVARGAVIGTVSSGGHCDARCLHIGVRVDGDYVSPMLFFDRVPPAVLLPLGEG